MKQSLSRDLNNSDIYILFGGPSLKGFDLSKLDNKVTLGCNKSSEVYKCTIALSIDLTYINTRRDFLKNYDGYVALASRETRIHPTHGMTMVDWIDPDFKYRHCKERDLSENDDFLYGLNTGHAAINFAMLQGFKTIHALGLDLNTLGHWHGGYSHGRQYPDTHKSWADDMNNFKGILNKWGVKMINYNPDSAVNEYEFGNLEDIK